MQLLEQPWPEGAPSLPLLVKYPSLGIADWVFIRVWRNAFVCGCSVTQSCASLWDPMDCRHARLPYAWLQADQGTQYLCFVFISLKALEITGCWGLSLCPEAHDQRGDFLPALCASVSSSLKRIKDDLVLQHWDRRWAINGHEATCGLYTWLRKGP